MRLTLNICTAPLLAALLCTLAACSEGTKSGGADNGGGGSGAAGGEDATTSSSSGGGKAEGGSGGASGAATTTPATAGSAATGTGGSSGNAWIKCWEFADSAEQWKKNYAQVATLTDKAVRDSVEEARLLSETKGEWVALEGYGKVPGYVELTIPFRTDQSDFQGVEYSYLPGAAITNLRGRTLHAFVQLVSGMTADDSSKPSGGKLIVKSGADYYYADGGWVNLTKNDWTELMLEVDKPTNVDASKDASLYNVDDIREIAIAIHTSGSATTIVSPAVVKIDHICY